MNHELDNHRLPYRPIDPAAARRESEPSPWPTQAGTRRELVCRAARAEGRRTLARARTAADLLVAGLGLLAVGSFVAAAAWAIAGLWR